LVVFDHDGVLVDSETMAMTIIAELMTEHGLPMSVQEATDTFLGTSLAAVMDWADQRAPGLDRDDFADRFHGRLFDDFRERLVAIPGMSALLRDLTESGVHICIASSGTSERVRLGLSRSGLAHYFPPEAITTGDHVERAKPYPDLFLLAAQRAQVRPERCIVVEDSAHGVEAARRAGMRVIALAHQTPAAQLTNADWVVQDAQGIRMLLLGAPD